VLLYTVMAGEDASSEKDSKSGKDDLWNWFVADWRRIAIAGLLVALLSALFSVPYAIRPLREYAAARSWPVIPARVLSSTVVRSRTSRTYVYRVSVKYRYLVNATPYISDRYSLTSFRSSNEDAIQAIVARYPPGSETQCYVDPQFPNRALLSRHFDPNLAYQVWLVIGAFVIGIWMLICSLILRRMPDEKDRAGLFLLLGLILAFMGCISILLWQSIEELKGGHAPWFFLALFSILDLAMLCSLVMFAFPLLGASRFKQLQQGAQLKTPKL
jgi:hypothetical protein